MTTSGYSKTPLTEKLGIKAGYKIATFSEPPYYMELLSHLPKDVEIIRQPEEDSMDFIHLFARDISDMQELVPKAIKALKKNGSLWVSWPKGSSGIQTDISRDTIRNYVLQTDLVDVKVAAIDDTWSGLKFMFRTKSR